MMLFFDAWNRLKTTLADCRIITGYVTVFPALAVDCKQRQLRPVRGKPEDADCRDNKRNVLANHRAEQAQRKRLQQGSCQHEGRCPDKKNNIGEALCLGFKRFFEGVTGWLHLNKYFAGTRYREGTGFDAG